MQTTAITVKTPKPRARHVNQVLRSKRCGRMRSPLDFNRAAQKHAAQRLTHE